MAGGSGGCMGSWAHRWKPCAAMVLVQLLYSLVDMALKTAYGLGMRPIVFVAYRQGIAAATLLLASLATRGFTLHQMAVGYRAFVLLFVVSLACAMGQYCYSMGLQLASPSIARATTNLGPGIMFAMAAIVGMEKMDLRSSRSVAKIIGTVVCLSGGILMAFFKGPKLLGTLFIDDWVTGGIYLMGNALCYSVWYIIQVPVSKSYLDPLSLATWMCFLATLQCMVMAFFLEANYIEIWKLASVWELPCILYAGVFASGANFFMQSWCISVKGPLYSAIFTPLSAVITTIFSTFFFHEELHIGSILGIITIIFGVYVVLWGKAGDAKSERQAIHSNDSESIVQQDRFGVKVESETNLSEPLFSEKR